VWSGAVSNHRPTAFQFDRRPPSARLRRWQEREGGDRRCLLVLAVAVPIAVSRTALSAWEQTCSVNAAPPGRWRQRQPSTLLTVNVPWLLADAHRAGLGRARIRVIPATCGGAPDAGPSRRAVWDVSDVRVSKPVSSSSPVTLVRPAVIEVSTRLPGIASPVRNHTPSAYHPPHGCP
jgi:hypothetical protein